MIKLQFAHKLIILSSALLIFALGTSAFSSYTLLKDKTESDLVASISEISESTSANISEWLNAKANIVLSMGKTVAKNTEREAVLKVIQQSLLAGKFKNTFVGLAENKKMILDDVSVTLPENYDPTSRPWYTLAKEDGRPAYTEPYFDATDNYLVISISTAMYHQNRYLGAAGADIQLTDIVNIVNHVDYLGLGYAFLVTEEGKILSHPNKKWSGDTLDGLFGRTPSLSKELSEYRIEDIDSLVSFIKIDGIESVDWYLGVVLDKDKAYASVSELKTQSLIYSLVGVIATITLMNLLLSVLLKPIRNLSQAIKDIAQGSGDLTQRLEVQTQDEIGQLSSYFNQFLDKIHESICNVNSAVNQLEQNISQVREVIDSSNSMFTDQTNRTQNVEFSIKQLSQASIEISSNAQRASTLATNIHNLSNESREALAENTENIGKLSNNLQISGNLIHELNDNTENIESILDVIKSVSDLTNLLSLNAAIEAARAGEQGRGFAVVADEVRQLAHRTTDSTNQIQEMIQTLQEGALSVGRSMEDSLSQSDVCVSSASEAGEKMDTINQAIDQIEGENQSVASATEEQSHVIEDINNETAKLAILNLEGSKNLDRIAEECNLLQSQYDILNRLVRQFKI